MALRGAILSLAFVLGACSPRPPESASDPIATTQATIAPSPSTSSTTITAGEPSQSPEDALRDGVVAEVAAAPIELRVNGRLSAGDAGWSWVVSELSEEFFEVADYGELLLMEGDRIFRAFPSPGAPLSWMHLANEALYAGHIGDGGLPHSTIMRVDRLTLETEVWVFEHSASSPAQGFPPLWRIASGPDSRRYEELVSFGPDFVGLAVQSLVGDVRIDRPRWHPGPVRSVSRRRVGRARQGGTGRAVRDHML